MEQELLGVKSQYPALRAIVNKLASEEVIQTGTTHGTGRHSCVMDKVMRWRWKLEEGSTEVAFGRTFYRDEVYYLNPEVKYVTCISKIGLRYLQLGQVGSCRSNSIEPHTHYLLC